METIFSGINENWLWLGPWLLASLGTACIGVILDVFSDLQEEMDDFSMALGEIDFERITLPANGGIQIKPHANHRSEITSAEYDRNSALRI